MPGVFAKTSAKFNENYSLIDNIFSLYSKCKKA